MKITLFTKNNVRHNYLISLLSKISDKLFVIQESEIILQDVIPMRYQASAIIKEYFEKVNEAQFKLFKNSNVDKPKKNTKILTMPLGDLNKHSLESLSDFLKSDIYIIFGGSYIKGALVDFLIEQKAINIHAGISPYYRGTDCNFWALYDGNPHLVGATIHLLSKGLDNGPMLYHAMSNLKTDPFEYTMSAVKAAFHSIAERIKDRSIFRIVPIIQDNNKEIRYSQKIEFNDKIVKEYFKKEINLNSKKFDNLLLKEPFFLEK
jgi:methionyl-tRNA formyltransferase